MQKGDKFIYKNELTKKSEIVTYTGTRREVKGCEFEFFIMCGDTAFFTDEEVNKMIPCQIQGG